MEENYTVMYTASFSDGTIMEELTEEVQADSQEKAERKATHLIYNKDCEYQNNSIKMVMLSEDFQYPSSIKEPALPNNGYIDRTKWNGL